MPRWPPICAAAVSQAALFAASGPEEIEAWPAAPDLAVLACPGGDAADALAALGRKGTTAALVLTMAPALEASAQAAGVRVLGPGSFGLAIPALGLNASRAHLPVPAGNLALVSQSAALCRAVLDWAGPNGIGFSHIVGIGGHADLGFGAVLDWLSRDSGTRLILLDIRRIKNPRAFLSAARACARFRPVVAIRAGGRLRDPRGEADAVFAAALHRAGVLTVERVEELLAAAETLARARPAARRGARHRDQCDRPRPARGRCRAAGRHRARAAHGGHARGAELALPEGASGPGPVYAGPAEPLRLAETAAMLAGAPEVGGVLVVHAPTGAQDAVAMTALAAGGPALKVPLLVCAMGETTGAGHRAALARAGLPVFASPEQAVRGFRVLIEQRRARAAARELPPSTVLALAPDRAAVRAVLARAREDGRLALAAEEGLAVLSAYGLRMAPPGSSAPAAALRLRVADDPVFGPAIGLGLGGAAGAVLRDFAFDLPPLNLPLARALVARLHGAAILGALADRAGANAEAVAGALVRVSQLVVDFPEIAALELDPLFAEADGVTAGAALVALRAAGEAVPLAIAPYPEELSERLVAGGEAVTLRPVRPEDAAAHRDFFTRLSPEDVRLRFFTALRALSDEQVARMTQVDYDREMAFIAVRERDGATVGVARLVAEPSRGDAEFAAIVAPDMKGRGIATRLMQRSIAWARAQGITVITGQVLAENRPMLEFVRRLGFTLRSSVEDAAVVEARLELAATSERTG